MYRTILNPYPIRTSRVSAPYSRIAHPRTVVGDIDIFRWTRDISGDTYRPSTLLSNPSQLVDPELRGGDALFPNLRVGRFGDDALYEDNTVLRVAEMIRPDVIDLTSTNPTRRAKALEDIQFSKAGQSPGQAKALAELIRKNPELASSFNIGYGSSLNREQGLAQKEGRVYEFDPTDEMWKSDFKRKNPDIVAMSDLQDALLTLPSGSQLTTYDGRPLDPAFTKAYYNRESTQDINDPQLFFNPKSRANIDYQGLADAFESIPKDVTSKTGKSLRDRWDRTKDYKAYPPRGQTFVINPDKKTQTIGEIIADVDKIESPYFSSQFADNRIQRSLSSSGQQDLNNIPKDYTRKAYLENMGDSDNLPDLPYSDYSTATRLFGNLLGDKRGDYIPKYQFTDESNLIGREIGEDNARIAYEPSDEWLRLARLANSGDIIGTSQRSTKYPVKVPIEDRRVYRKAGELNIEDRDFLLSSPVTQLPIRASASILPPNYLGADRQFGYYGNNRDIPTSLSAIEEGLTERKGSIVGYVDARRKQRPTTRLEREEVGADYFNPYRESYGKGETNLSDNLYLRNFSEAPNNIYSTALAWDESNPNIANYPRRISEYYRLPSQTYSVGRRDNLPMYVTKDGEERYFKTFTSPEVVLPKELTYRGRSALSMMPSSYSPKQSPNQYRIAGSTAPQGGYREFNEVMDEGIQASRDLDRLYKENDELADLASLPFFSPLGEAIAYQQSDILDRIVDAERIAENMGGTYRRLAGKGEQGVVEALGLYNEPAPSQLIQYNINEVLEPSFASDYGGRANTGRVRTSVGTEYDAGIPVGATVKTRIANPVIGPIQLDDPNVEPFNVAQYNRDLLKRGSILIDTQLGIPIVKAPTSSFNPMTQRNESYLQPVRPSRVVDNPLPWGPIDNTANWQAPESLAIGRVGKGIAVRNIPELPVNTGVMMSSPIPLGDIYGPPTPMRRATLPSRDRTDTQGQILYPNAGIGPINTGLKPKPTIGELFGFTALTPEGLAKYRNMG